MNLGDIRTWFSTTYPNDPIANLENALDLAEEMARNASAFEALTPEQRFEKILTEPIDYYASYEVRLRVGIPIPGTGTFYTTVKVDAMADSTKQSLIDEAITIGMTRAMPGFGPGKLADAEIEEAEAHAILGLIL